MSEPIADFLCAMAQDDDDLFDAALLQVVDAGFDDGLFAEGK